MINIHKETSCCGCAACANVCTRQAITMQRDKKGFLYPVIEAGKCNNCGLCEKICPMLNGNEERIPVHTFALKNKNEAVRMQSSSGGLFTILAEGILRENGVVYGAVFNEEWNVIHTRIDSTEELHRLRGSKYVQSVIGDIFKQVREDLKANKKVLFSGSPCQVAGLNAFLRKEYDNLTTVDFVCHGVPNPRIWEEYLQGEISARRAAAGKSSDFSSSLPKRQLKAKKVPIFPPIQAPTHGSTPTCCSFSKTTFCVPPVTNATSGAVRAMPPLRLQTIGVSNANTPIFSITRA